MAYFFAKSPTFPVVPTYIYPFCMQGYLLKNKAHPREYVNEVADWYSAVISGHQGKRDLFLNRLR